MKYTKVLSSATAALATAHSSWLCSGQARNQGVRHTLGAENDPPNIAEAV